MTMGYSSLNLDVLKYIIADTYYNAANANVDMIVTAEALETIRNAMLEKDLFELWDTLDDQIGSIEDEYLQSILISLRSKFEKQFYDTTLDYLNKLFTNDSEYAWIIMLQTFAKAFTTKTNDRVSFCLNLALQNFNFPTNKQEIIQKIRSSLRYIQEERWSEAYDFPIFLSNQDFISIRQRIEFLVSSALIQIYYLSKQKKGKDLLDQAHVIASDQAKVEYGFGHYWLNQDYKAHIDKAQEFFQRALKLDPHFIGAYLGMGDCFLKQENLDAAEEWYQEAIKHNKGKSFSYLVLADFYGHSKLFSMQKEKILDLAKRAIAVDSESEYNVYLTIGNIFYRNNEIAKARSWHQKAIDLHSSWTLGYIWKSYTYIEEKNFDMAFAVIDEALTVAGESFECYWAKALIKQEEGLPEESMKWYQEALKYRPSWKNEILIKTAEIKIKLRRNQEAENDLLDALKFEPDNEYTLNSLYNLAYDYYKKHGDTNSAIRVYNMILKIKGESYKADYHYNLSALYRHIKDWDKARQEIELAFKIDGKRDLYQTNMGIIFYEEGNDHFANERYSKAVEKYTEAIKMDPIEQLYTSSLYDAQFRLKFGKDILSMVPIATPIIMEISNDLVPYVSSEGKLTDEVNTLIANMRDRILKRFGVLIPGIRFRLNDSFSNGTYMIMLMENPIDSGKISLHKRIFAGNKNEIDKEIFIEEITNPETMDPAYWIKEEDWKKIEREGLQLWKIIEYPLHHLENILIKNMSEFIDHQAILNKLTDLKLSNSFNITVLTTIMKALVAEMVPIKDFETIVKVIDNSIKNNKDLLTIIEIVRSTPYIQEKLPGNNDKYYFYELGETFEDVISRSICRMTYDNSILAINHENSKNLLSAVEEKIGPGEHIAIIVSRIWLRPYVSQLIRSRFPLIPVLSRSELLYQLESKIIGEIELKQQDYHIK